MVVDRGRSQPLGEATLPVDHVTAANDRQHGPFVKGIWGVTTLYPGPRVLPGYRLPSQKGHSLNQTYTTPETAPDPWVLRRIAVKLTAWRNLLAGRPARFWSSR